VELEPLVSAVVEPVEGCEACADPLIEPCAFVSVPVELVDAVVFGAVAVPCAVACVPAVDPLPDTNPDWGVPVSFADVRVVLLLLLQPKTSAAASARPYAYFMCCLLKGG
jgi:hypothetical protein